MSLYWTEEQFSKASREDINQHLALLDKATKANTERFGRENGDHPGWKSLMYALEAGQRGVRQGIGAGYNGAHWSSQSARDFRYNSLPLFNGYATFVQGLLRGAKSMAFDGGLAGAAGIPGVIASAAKFTMDEGNKGFPWAKANPDWVESAAMTTLDPLWGAGYLSSLGKMAWAAPEIRALTPFAKAINGASHAEVVAALKPLWGADAASPIFYKALAETAKLHPEQLPEFLYHQGFRSSEWAQKAAMPISAYFKRGGNLASPSAMKTLQEAWSNSKPAGERVVDALSSPQHASVAPEWNALMEAMDREFNAALQSLPSINDAEKATINWLEHNVPRMGSTLAERKASFRAYYDEMRAAGTAPALDKAILDKAEVYIGQLSAGWREGTAYINAYGTSEAVANRINKGMREAVETLDDLPGRGWRLPRRTGQGMIDAISNFQAWHASTFTREKFADSLASVTKTILDRAKVLDEAAAKGGQSAESLRAEAELMRGAAAAVQEYGAQPDFVKYGSKKWAAMTKSEKAKTSALAALEVYDKGLRWAKAAMLRPNPAFYMHRLTDMAGMRSLVETGDTVMGEALKAMWTGVSQPKYTSTGKQIDFARHATEAQFGMGNLAPKTAWQKVSARLDQALEAIDNTALNHIGRYHFDAAARKALKAGHSLEVAEGMGTKAAEKAVDLVHGMYTSRSPAMHVMRRAFMFPEHYLGRMSHLLTRGLERPAESYALLRLREKQQQGSIDRRGTLKLPLTDRAWDPFRRTTPGQVLDSLLNSDEIMNAQDRSEWKIMKGLELLTGPMTPPVNLAAERAGITKEMPHRDLTNIEEIVGSLSHALVGDELTPSDMVSSLMGNDPGETKQNEANRRAMRLHVSAKLAGEEITPEEAVRRSNHEDVKTAVLGMLTGQSTMYAPPGTDKMLEGMWRFREELASAPPELRPAVRQVLLAEPGIAELEPLLPKDPAARFGALEYMGNQQRAESDVRMTDPNTKAEKDLRLQQVEDAWKKSKLGIMLGALVPKAGAATVDSNPPPVDTTVDFIKGSNGRAVPAPGGTLTTIEKARALNEWNMIEPQLRKAESSVKDVHAFIAGGVRADGFNPVLARVRSVAPFDARAQSYLETYNYVDGKGATPISGELPSGLNGTVLGISKAFSNFVANSGQNAGRLITATPDQIRKGIENGSIPLAVGTTLQNYDDYAIKAAQQAAAPMVGIAHKNWELKQKQDFPGNDYWTDQLRSSAYNNPKATADVIHSAMASMNDLSAAPQYKASPDLFKIIETKNPALYDRIAAASSYDDIVGTLNRVTRRDPLTGRPMALDVPAMRLEIARGNDSGLAAIRAGWAGRDLQGMMERAIASEPLPGSELGKNMRFNLNEIPVDPSKMGEYFREPLKVMTGEHSNEFASALRTATAGVAAVTEPTTAGDQQYPSSRFLQSIGSSSTPLPQGAIPGEPVFGGKAPMAAAVDVVRQQDITPILPIRTSPHGSIGAYVTSTLRDYNTQLSNWKAGGSVGPQPSLMATGASNLYYTPITGQDASGRAIVGAPVGAINGAQMVGAVASLGQVAGALGAYDKGSDVASGFSGLGLALGSYSAMAMLAGPLMMAGPVGWGVLAASAAIGVAGGLMGGGKGDGGEGQRQSLAIQRERLELDRQRFEESMKQQTIRDLRTRESDLAKSVSTMTPGQRAQVEPRLAAFTRRPTYQSRIGLVDAAERAIGSAIHPRW